MTDLEAAWLKFRDAIADLRRPHFVLDEDCWYSCPLALDDDGRSECCNDFDIKRGTCTCGADAHNAKVDAVLAAMKIDT